MQNVSVKNSPWIRLALSVSTLAFTGTACSLDPNAGGVRVRLDVAASPNVAARSLSQAMVGSYTVDSFDCLIVDISGPGIPMMGDPRPASSGAARVLAAARTLEGAPKAAPPGRRMVDSRALGWTAQESSRSLGLRSARLNHLEGMASSGPESCSFPSVTSQIVSAAEGGEVLLRVPAGSNRKVRVIGLSTMEGGCPYAGRDYMEVVRPFLESGQAMPFQEAVLGESEVSLYADSTVYVQNTFDPDHWQNAFGCPGDSGPMAPQFLVATTKGLNSTCVSPANGMVKCWGDATMGQLGYGGVSGSAIYTNGQQVEVSPGIPLRDVVDLQAGSAHFCALTMGGQLYCWGDNSSGQIGDGTSGNNRPNATLISVPTAGSEGVWDVATGGLHTCVSDFYENLYCWGDNAGGQLGLGHNTDVPSPTWVETFVSIGQTAAGGDNTCVVDSGFVSCWGNGSSGVLGNGSLSSINVADSNVYLPGSAFQNESVIQVSVGPYSTACAVTDVGSVFCWGAGTGGQMGDGTNMSQNLNPVLTALDGFAGNRAWRVAVGGGHVCALRLDAPEDYLMCWGDGAMGQLANGSASPSNVPVLASATNAYQALSLGSNWGCAVSISGTYFCWGMNGMGQLGTGDTTSRNTPHQVAISF